MDFHVLFVQKNLAALGPVAGSASLSPWPDCVAVYPLLIPCFLCPPRDLRWSRLFAWWGGLILSSWRAWANSRVLPELGCCSFPLNFITAPGKPPHSRHIPPDLPCVAAAWFSLDSQDQSPQTVQRPLHWLITGVRSHQGQGAGPASTTVDPLPWPLPNSSLASKSSRPAGPKVMEVGSRTLRMDHEG